MNPIEENPDRIAIIDVEDAQGSDDEETSILVSSNVSKRGQKKGRKSAIDACDQRFLSLFIATPDCRQGPWDIFFNNSIKCNGFMFHAHPY
jgi:hypothetical protein